MPDEPVTLSSPIALTHVEADGVPVVEGEPDRPFMLRVDDVNRLIEASLSHQTPLALLYAANLSAGFFDLSSGEAGALLQKCRNYGVTLAVVCPAGSVRFSSRFGEMLAEERRRGHFDVFGTRDEAWTWLARRWAALSDADRQR